MAKYWITFRVGEAENYRVRYAAFIKAVDDATTRFWAETTSFYLAETSLALTALGQRLITTLNRRHDILVLRTLDHQEALYFGPLKHEPILLAFMPYAKKL